MIETHRPDTTPTGQEGASQAGGEAPMSESQRTELQTLSAQADVPDDPLMTQAQARQRIDELKTATGHRMSNGAPEEREDGDGGLAESLGRAISAPFLDAGDAADGAAPRSSDEPHTR